MSDDEYEVPENGIPSIYIDKSILTTTTSFLNNSKDSPKEAYLINNTTFINEERSNEEFVEFELYAEKLTNLGNRRLFTGNEIEDAETPLVYYSTSDESEDSEPNNDKPLKIKIQTLPHGIVINSNVYLTHEQWNTIVFVDVILVKCVVCELYTDVEHSEAHIHNDGHKKELNRYKPLDRFDLSITRKIREKYHCAVCNEIFNLDADIEHYASKSHEGNLLSAINKISDLNLNRITNDNNKNNDINKKNDYYHFNRDNLNNARNKNNEYRYNASDEDSEYEIQDEEFDTDDDTEGACFWETEKNSQPENSYAKMAKKPKLIELPLFLEKQLGNRKVKVKFDSWHMLISPKVNRFYCMACKEFSHIRGKSEHSSDINHLNKLEKCKIVTAFGDYLIRKIDDSYYHCGHCNFLVLCNDIEYHLENYHAKFNKNTRGTVKNEDNIQIENEATRNSIKDTNDTNFDKNPMEMNAINNETDMTNINKFMNEKTVLTVFGYKLTVPLVSFHVLCKRIHDYYCGLCNVICTENMVEQHIYCIAHIQMLQRTPFILPFNCNLIRAIREALHCAICNIPIAASIIYIHIRDPQHIKLLTKALADSIPTRSVPNQNPIAQTAYDPSMTFKDNQITNPMQTVNKITKQTKLSPEKTKLTNENTKSLSKITKDMQVVTERTEAAEDKDKLRKEIEFKENEITMADDIDLNVSVESEFDIEDLVYVKLRNKYFRITLLSYNTLVYLGDSNMYCFVCSLKVYEEELKIHINCRPHLENMNKIKFLDRDDCLLRQLFLMYHCSTCNVLISRRELKNHLNWQTHIDETSLTLNISKRIRKNELKSGTNLLVASTQKEEIYLNEKETETKLLFKIKIIEKKDVVLVKKMKIVIVNGDVLKLNFENYNSVIKVRNGLKCQLCQIEFCDEELPAHIASKSHAACLTGSTFNGEYMSDLIRPINEFSLHCVICNTEVSNKDFVIIQHIEGKKHKKNYETIRNTSSTTSAYTDCEGEVIQL